MCECACVCMCVRVCLFVCRDMYVLQQHNVLYCVVLGYKSKTFTKVHILFV